jgi:NADH-quinone oxidoreductase subunit L
MTACYMFRQVFMTFFGECRADEEVQHHIHESPATMTMPLVLLAAGSIFAGFLGVPEFLGGSNRFEAWLAPVFEHGHHAAAHHAGHDVAMEWTLMAISVAVATSGVFLAYLFFYRRSLSADRLAAVGGGGPYRLLLNKYYVDALYNATIVRGTLLLARFWAWFDGAIVDGIVNGTASVTRAVSAFNGIVDNRIVDALVNLVANRTFALGTRLRHVQTGGINAYLYVIVGTVTLVLIARLM